MLQRVILTQRGLVKEETPKTLYREEVNEVKELDEKRRMSFQEKDR